MPEDIQCERTHRRQLSNLPVWLFYVRRRPIDWAADAGLFVATLRFLRMR